MALDGRQIVDRTQDRCVVETAELQDVIQQIGTTAHRRHDVSGLDDGAVGRQTTSQLRTIQSDVTKNSARSADVITEEMCRLSH